MVFRHLGKEAALYSQGGQLLHTVSTFILGPTFVLGSGDDFATPLSLVRGHLCHFHGSEALKSLTKPRSRHKHTFTQGFHR